MRKIKIKIRKILVFLVAFAILIQAFYPVIPFLPSFGNRDMVSANEDILAVGEKEKVMFQNVNPEFKVEFGNKEAIDKPFMRFESISSGDNPFAKEENEKIKPGIIERLVSSVFEEKKQGVELTLLSAGNDLNVGVKSDIVPDQTALEPTKNQAVRAPLVGAPTDNTNDNRKDALNASPGDENENENANTNDNAPVGADLRVRPENRNTNEAEGSDENTNDNVTVRAPLVGAPTSPPTNNLNVLLSTETKEVPATVGAGLVPAQTDNDGQASVGTPLVGTRTTTTVTSSPKKSAELLDAEAEVIAEEKILEQMEKELDNMINDVDWKLSSNEELAAKKAQLKRQIMDDLLREEEAKAQTVVESINLETVSDLGEKKKDVIKNVDFVPGVDAEYSIKEGEGVKEEIIIKNSDSFSGKCIADKVANPETNCFLPKNVYTFSLKLDADVNMKHAIGIMNEKNPQGVTYFTDENNKYLFHFEPLFAVDAKGNRTDAVRFEITEDNNEIGMENGKQVANSKGEGLTIPSREGCPNNSEGGVCQEKGSDLQDFTHPVSPSAIHPSLEGILHSPFINIARAAESKTYTLKVIVDPSWLLSPERAFPVRIDPSIVHNTKVQFDAGSALNRVETTSDPKIQEKNLESKADANTVGLWHMNETSGTTVTDSSGKGNNGTTTGTTIVDGKLGKARSFNGTTSDYITLGTTPLTTGATTISMWVKKSSADLRYTADLLVGGAGLLLWTAADGSTGMGFRGYTLAYTSSKVAYTINTWYHISYIYNNGDKNSTSSYKIYVNGIEQPLLAGGVHGSATTTNFIGREVNNTMPFNGLIDEVKISNAALTPEQIKADFSKTAWAHYTSSVLDLSSDLQSIDSLQWSESGVGTGDAETPYSSTGLVGHWKFNETSGTTATDSSGSGNNGTLTNFSNTTGQDVLTNSGWTANNAKWPRSSPKALMFDGSDDYVNVPYNSAFDFGTNNFSIGAWMNTNKPTEDRSLIEWGAYNGNGFLIRLNEPNSSYPITIYIGSVRYSWNYTFIPNNWYYLNIVRTSSTTIVAYVNGISLGAQTIPSGATITAGGGAIKIGQLTSGAGAANWSGSLDNVQIYSRALSADEILANYNATNIEFQTRTGTDATPDDGGWEDWKPNTSESQLLSMDADQNNWDGKFDQYTKLLMHANGANNSTSVIDSSLSRKPVSVAGDAKISTTQSKFDGSSIYLDGSGDYLSIPDSDDWNFGSGDFTIDLWAFPTRTGNYGLGGQYPAGGGLNQSWALFNGNDDPSINLGFTDGTYVLSDCGTLSLNTWSHVSFVRNGSNLYCFLNGTLSDTDNIGSKSVNNSTANVELGRFHSGYNDYYYQGYIDEFRFSKGNARWTSNFTPPNTAFYNPSLVSVNNSKVDNDANTKLLLHSDGTNNSTAFADSSFGQKSVSALGGAIISTTQSKFGGSSMRGGQTDSDYVQMPANSDWNFGTGDFTIDFWMNFNSFTRTINNINSILGNDTTADGDERWTIGINSGPTGHMGAGAENGSLGFYNGSAWNHTGSFKITNTGQWYHIVVSRSGTTAKIFVDGTERASWTDSNSIGNSSTPLSMLYRFHSTQNRADGYMDEIRVSKGIARWTSGFSVPTSAHTNPYDQKIEGSGSMKVSTGQMQPDANTVGLWHLDETGGTGAYLKDVSGNGNNGTPTGTTLVNGIAGKARSFNGSSDYVNITNFPTSVTGSNPRTIEAWYKVNISGYYSILGFSGASLDRTFEMIQNADNTMRVHLYADNLSLSITPAIGQWHHLAFSYDGSTIKAYIDGILINSGNYSLNTNNNFFIGAGSDGGGSPVQRFFNGQIDEVRISNIARTPEEIAESYRMGRDHRISRTITSTDLSSKTKLPFWVAGDRPGTYMEATAGESAFANYEPDGNTMGLWHLDEQSGSGAYIKDSSNYGNHGTPTGTTFTQGKIGKARSFNGSSEKVSITDNSGLTLGTNPFTISAWVNYSATGGTYSIMGQDEGGGTLNKWIFYQSGGTLLFHFNGPTPGNQNPISYSWTPTVGQWYLLTVTRSGSTFSLYINGMLTSTGSNALSIPDPATNMNIGWSEGTLYFNGLIDESRLDNIARTPAEIRQAYEVGLRTHPITIEFNAKLDAGNLIANSGDTSFTIDTTASGSYSNKGENLFNGDKIIIKENYDGTEYLAQGTVTSVNVSTGAVTVASWDSGSTFPASGFTANATVFKWQREYMDLTSPLTSQVDAATRLTLRCTDGNEGRNIFLDDFKAGGPYLTTPNATGNVTSTKNRYMQYRAMFSTTDGNVTPALTGATVNYSNGPSSTDVLMRHGRWFDSSGTLKPHWWGR